MAQYDGSIRINTEINAKNAKVQLSTLENRIVKTADKISSLRSKMDALKDVKIPTQEFEELSNSLKKAESNYEKLKLEAEKPAKHSDEYKLLVKDLEKAEKELQKLANEQEMLEKIGLPFDKSFNEEVAMAADKVENIKEKMNFIEISEKSFRTEKLQEASSEIEKIKAQMQQISESGKAFTLGQDTEKYANLGQQLKYVENEMDVLTQKHDIQSLKVKKTENEYRKLGSTAGNALRKIGSIVKESAISSMQRLGSSLKSIASRILNVGKNAKSASSGISSMGTGFKNMIKNAIGISSVYMLFNKLRTAAKYGFENLAQVSKPVNKSISSLMSALTQLKNSIATAFAPVLTAAAPALTTLINMASKAATSIGMLIAALTGQKTFTKATAVQQDYAASLKKTSSEAKKANKRLSSLDKLNNLTTQDKDSGDKDSGISPSDMFEKVDITPKIGDFAKKIKEAWKNADFTEIGSIIGTKLKNALDNIPWDKIKKTAAKVGKSFATLINGFVEVPGLATTIGKTIGEAINTGITGINAFLDNTHWDSVGKFIGNGLNGIVKTINWKELGRMFGSSFNAILQTIENAAKTFDWKKLGSSIATGINSAIKEFNPNYLSASINSVVIGILDMLIEFLGKTDFKNFGSKIAEVINGIKWVEIAGKTSKSLSKLISGMLSLLIGFVEKTKWGKLGTNIWKSLVSVVTNIEWSKLTSNLFELLGSALAAWGSFNAGILKGIGGTISKLFKSSVEFAKSEIEKAGGNVFQGMLNGIVDAAKGIGDWVKKNIFDPFIKGFKSAFGIHSPSTVMKEQGKYIISGLLSGLKENIGTVKNWLKNVPVWFKEKFDKAYSNAKNAFSNAKKGFENVWSNIKKGFGNIPDWFEKKFSAAWTAVKNVFSKGGKVFTGIKDGILSGLKSVIRTLIDGINKVIKEPFDGLNTALGKIRSFKIAGKTPFGSIPTIKTPQIPALAKGAVIPPNKEFLAVLGDQKHGTNIEAPLSTIEQAVTNAIRKNGGITSGNGNITLNIKVDLDGREVFRNVQKYDREQFNTTGRPSFII